MDRSYVRRLRALVVFLGIAACASQGAAYAGSFKVSPVKVELTPAAPTAAIVVQNESETESVVVQLQANRWSQENGLDVYASSPEFIATPPIFSLKPRASQIIRVGLRKAERGATEATYRLYITEVPPAPKAGFRGLQVALNVGVPIFIAPKTPARAQPVWRAELASDKKLVLSAHNPANSHVQFLGTTVSEQGTDTPIALLNKPRYALAGQTIRWELPLNRVPSGPLRVAARTAAGDTLEEVVAVSSAGKS